MHSVSVQKIFASVFVCSSLSSSHPHLVGETEKYACNQNKHYPKIFPLVGVVGAAGRNLNIYVCDNTVILG